MILSNTALQKWKHQLDPKHPFVVLDFAAKRVTSIDRAGEHLNIDDEAGWMTAERVCEMIKNQK